MPKTPKSEREEEKPDEIRDEQFSWAEDQKKHEYYYDDAHGYEIYDPNKEKIDDLHDEDDD